MSADRRKIRFRKVFLLILAVFALAVILGIWFQQETRIRIPEIATGEDTAHAVIAVSPDLSYCGKSWLRKNREGLYEMYLEGTAFERGVASGRLTKDLIEYQERAFTAEIAGRIPSPVYLKFLKYFIYWFNRDLDEFIPEEYKQEIYGISLSASKKYSYIGTNYQRMLNYHSAHDIGHALQQMKLVGCTSLGAWDQMAQDSSLLIGRNFDFYAGDDFSKNKIVCFQKPETGYPFMMITWGSMIGVVSGMNTQGLTVTINAARSEIPWSARTPVSILAREILQYASDISEAMAIAQKRQTFVSESFMIGSAKDNKAVIIEKSPFKTVLKEPVDEMIICANHFQSDEFSSDPLNIQDKKENASPYRQARVQEIAGSLAPLNPEKMATILRDRHGKNNLEIGNGNEKAINQFVAHHSVIFEPGKRLVWVSTSPWQLGNYVCYDLFKIFHIFAVLHERDEITETEKVIPPDPYLKTGEYNKFLQYRILKSRITTAAASDEKLSVADATLREMTECNPEFFEAYETAGDYSFSTGEYEQAAGYYYKALGKVIPGKKEKDRIIKKLADSNVKKQKNNE